ncbi:MAG: adenylate/guanylate cyclase domain-containing protein [Calditrichia bacterium]|nr:adenylate/guanylate cyclase domain-containing protein [Calditrichia bacterium]
MKKYSILTIAGIILGVFLIALMLQLIPAMQALELKTIDWRFQWRGPLSVEDSPIVLVTIDDQSFESLPERWPWPRSYYAHVVENLTEAGARVIGIDVILDIPDQIHEGSDEQLAEAIKASGKVVLAGKVEDSGRFRSYPILVKPIQTLLDADSSWGITAIQSDPDGIHRQYFVAQKYQEEILPSFGLELLRKYLEIPASEPVQVSADNVKLGELNIPLSFEGLMRIDFAGPVGTFPQYSFDTVIDDEDFMLEEDYDIDYFSISLLPDEIFKDKIVLIGSTVSELHDNFPAPFFEFKDRDGNYRKAETPGVEIHANAIWTILNQQYYKEFPHLFSLLLLLVLIGLVYFVVMRLSTFWSIIISVGLLLLYNLAQFYLFANFRLILIMVMPSLAIALSFMASTVYEYVATQREKRMIMGAFERFVPQKVVKELLDHPEKLKLGGEERYLSVLFTDLANFTSVSEKLKPTDLVNLINIYLTEMTEVVFKYDGIVDKYEGDALMAEFGAPVHFEDHAVKACYAAIEMQERLKKLDLSKYKKVISSLSCRIGINSGHMIVGNMGSKNVFDYTVMGDAVNLASRLEGANKMYGTNIMISEDTYKLVKDDVVSRPLDLIRVKGRQKPVRVLEVISRRDQKIPERIRSILPVFVNGIRYYHLRDWKKSEECFRFCLDMVPNDGPAKEYLRRVQEYAKTPPEDEWDGVYTLHSK